MRASLSRYLGVNVGQPDPRQTSTQHLGDLPMFVLLQHVQPTLDMNPDAILKSIILNAQSWMTTAPMRRACCNPCLHYSLANDRKGRRSRRHCDHGSARPGFARIHLCSVMILAKPIQRASKGLCAHSSILFRTTLIVEI